VTSTEITRKYCTTIITSQCPDIMNCDYKSNKLLDSVCMSRKYGRIRLLQVIDIFSIF